MCVGIPGLLLLSSLLSSFQLQQIILHFSKIMATTRTYGRGILRFTSWEPCRRPGQPCNSNGALGREETARKSCVENGSANHVSTEKNGTSQTTPGTAGPVVPIVPVQTGDKPVRLLAKYNYKGNPERPGGFDELTVTQGEKLVFCRSHPTNPHWWEVRHDNGDVGFVPSTYMMVLEDKISELPWLEEKKQLQRNEDEKDKRPEGKFGEPAFKPYVSAYGNNTKTNSSSENFYCDVCDKKLNGPIPYKMHLNSKAHKEEVALKEELNL